MNENKGVINYNVMNQISALMLKLIVTEADLITVSQAALILGVTPAAVRMKLQRKTLRYVTHSLLDRRDVLDLLKRGRVKQME